MEKIKHETEASIAPEICIEVISNSNTQKEMTEKKNFTLKEVQKNFGSVMKMGHYIFLIINRS